MIDLEQFIEESKKNIFTFDSLEELKESEQNILAKNNHKFDGRKYMDEHNKIQLQIHELRKLKVKFNNYRHNIINKYSNKNFDFCTPIKVINTENIETQLLEVINFELEVKNELKKLHKKYINKEIIENKLIELYKKRIEMLEEKLVSNDDSEYESSSNENSSVNENSSSDDDTPTHSEGTSHHSEGTTDDDI
jgi:hypothetical protein